MKGKGMPALNAVILAAGKGKRMKSDLAKVLHPVLGLPMVAYVIRAVREAGSRRIIVVVGHQRDRVREALADQEVEFAVQAEQLGTAHALAQTEEMLAGEHGDLLVLAGDTPLLTGRTLRRLVDRHHRTGAAATVLTATFEDPGGYGRIVRTPEGLLDAIVEDRDAAGSEKEIREINTGAYCFQTPLIFEILQHVDTANRQSEYYLTDAIALLRSRGMVVGAVMAEDWQEMLGINSAAQLAKVEQMMIRRVRPKNEKKG
jgi:bifunctional UDP-N-acetylglucosamine pyrophosphorylase/glucosamine-1-phosphate N-acetyltransferase